MSDKMIVVNTPSQELALTNLAYCSSADLEKFSIAGSTSTFVLVGDSIVLTLISHSMIADGLIALNSAHRQNTKVSTGDQISVKTFSPPACFSLTMLTVELNHVKAKANRNEELDAVNLAQHLLKKFNNQVMTTGQRVLFEFLGFNYIFTVDQTIIVDQDKSNAIERGITISDTCIVFEAVSSSGIKIINQHKAANNNIFRKDFNPQNLGIGGLSEEFKVIIQRAFISRRFPPYFIKKTGIKHVKGILLYGPPGTGKTLLARQIINMLNGREPKIVNGPEVLSKYVGETEKNVRDLFADAEQEERERGDESDLHVIIFDEIDAICKSRGSTQDGTGVHDGIVNQLLTKIDGVQSLNNVLLIGMTNRKDRLDEALLRPGRLEVQIEINLPNENGRLEILQIHTNKMKENSFLDRDVNLQELARMAKNYSGAELEGAIKFALSNAMKRLIIVDDPNKPLDENIKVTMDDFLNAFKEIIPAFGTSTDDLQNCRPNGMIDCGEEHKHIYEELMLLVDYAKKGICDPLVTCLLEGPSGSGKTTMAATIGIDSDFPFTKIVSADLMIGLSESSKCAKIIKVFEDAYKSELSIIILDDIERMLEYAAIGPRFLNSFAQTLMVLVRKPPPKGKKLLVIVITSEMKSLESTGLHCKFDDIYHLPTLTKEDATKVLEHLNVFKRDDIDAAAKALDGIPLKKLYRAVKRSINSERTGDSEAAYLGEEKIDLNRFYHILRVMRITKSS